MKKRTPQQTKHHNSRLVLKTLYQREPLSRADLARETGLTRPTISSQVADLLAANLVVEVGTAPSAGGKPPTLLEINQDGYHLMALDLGGSLLRGALVNLRGEIVTRRERPLANQTGNAALRLVYEMVDSLQAAADTPLLGAAVGSPGIVDSKIGVVRQAVNLDWENLPLQTRLAARTGLPTYITNDSQAAAMGEYTFGDARHGRNLIVIKTGRGIGAGVVLDGRLFCGDGFAAGEIGHIVVDDGGQLCRCGNVGCLETTAGADAILTDAASQLNQETVTWDEFEAALKNGHPAFTALITRVGRHLGMAIAQLIAAYNIDHLVLSGHIARFGDLILDVARAAARRRALPSMVDHTRIQFSTLGADIVLLGCAATVLKRQLGVV